MIVLWILLGLIALLFLLLCIPVRFDLNYNGEATVFIRYLFLKYRVLPAPEKKPEPIKEKKPSEKKSEEWQAAQPDGAGRTSQGEKAEPAFAAGKKI